MKYHQGKYILQNPNKYIGNPNDIIYRSSWEKRFLIWCDTNKNIIRFSSEEVVIPYLSPIDNRYHRYFVDFMIETSNGNKYLVEIKPSVQCKKPVPKKNRKQYLEEVKTYAINQTKWEYAKRYSEEHQMKFIVLNEYDLGIKKNNASY